MSENDQLVRVANPFPTPAPQEGGMVAVEQQRAMMEVLAAMQFARLNPRDQRRATDLILNDCAMPVLAEDATYEYARGGSSVDGPSIRLAETIAMRWGNFSCGVKEIARREGYSEVVAYAVDLQSNAWDSKTFQVRHWRDTKKGGYQVTDERDIYEVIANQGARRKRACILTLIPKDVIEAALRQCDVTLKAKIEITAETIQTMVDAFAKWSVTQEMIEKRIQRKLEAMQPGHVLSLKKIANSMRDGMSQPADWFDVPSAGGAQEGPQVSQADRVAAELAAKRKPPAPPSQPSTTPGLVDPDTGEITPPQPKAQAQTLVPLADLEKRIAEAGSNEQMNELLPQISAHPEGAERNAVSQAWMKRTMVLNHGPEKPKTSQQPPKPHGTEKIRADIIIKMNKAKNEDELNTARDSANLYAWDEADKKAIDARYQRCREDL